MNAHYSGIVAAGVLALVTLVSRGADKEPDELSGSWALVSADANGKQMELPAKGSPPMTLADGKCLAPDGKEALVAVPAPDGKEVPAAASYRTDSTKEPKEVDLINTVGDATVTMRGIYKIEKDQLTMCFGTIWEDQKLILKRPTDFASGDGKLLQVFQRAKEGEKAPDKPDGSRDIPEPKEQRERSAAARAAESDIIDRIAKAGGYAEFDPRRPKEGIKVVKLQGKGITDAELALVKDLTEVEGLYLAYSSVTDEGLAHVENLKELAEICLPKTRVTGKGLIHLRGLKKLQVLDLGSTRVGDEGLAHLQSLPLRNLNLNHTKVTDAGLAEIGKCEQLIHLYLSGTDVGDSGLAKLANLHELLGLTLDKTRVTDAGLKHLHGMKKLVMLGVSDTSVTAEGALDLEKLLPEVTVAR